MALAVKTVAGTDGSSWQDEAWRDGSLSAFDVYMREVRNSERLTRQEQQVLIRRLQRGRVEQSKPCPNQWLLSLAQDARRRLAEDFQPLVVRCAERYRGDSLGMEFGDLVGEGNIGLLVALDRCPLDESLTVRDLAGWVKRYVQGYMLKALGDRGRLIALPQRVRCACRKLLEMAESLERRLGRSPSVAEVAEAMGVSVEKVWELQAAAACLRIASVEGLLCEDEQEDERQWVSVFDSSGGNVPEQESERSALREKVWAALERLPARQRQAVMLLYGLGDEGGVGEHWGRKSEVAAVMGVKPGALYTYEQRALARLRLSISGGLPSEELPF